MELSLAHSGIPAVSESHIINPLLTKLVRSRWLDIGLRDGVEVHKLIKNERRSFFCEFMDLDSVSVHNMQKKNEANIHPS